MKTFIRGQVYFFLTPIFWSHILMALPAQKNCSPLFQAPGALVDQNSKKFNMSNAAPVSKKKFDFSNNSPDSESLNAVQSEIQNNVSGKTLRAHQGESVQLRDALSQFPSQPAVPNRFIYKHGSYLDPNGYIAHIDLNLSSANSPSVFSIQNKESDFSSLPKMSFKNETRLGQVAQKLLVESSHNLETVSSSSQEVLNPSFPIQHPETQKRSLYQQDERMYETLQVARNALAQLRRSESQAFKLRTSGPNRYFWYIPKGETTYKAARILDIHENFFSEVDRREYNSPYSSMHILAEWVGESEMGNRIRHIEMIKPDELSTLIRNSDFSEEAAAFEFFKTLTLTEIQTLSLAKKLGLTTFGFTPSRRIPGEHDPLQRGPLTELNSVTHLAIKGSVLKDFGPIDDLLLPQELAKKNETLGYNIIDVFSRLDPRFVLKRLGADSPQDPYFYVSKNYEYNWVITEDGRLKISPHMRLDNNLKPQLLRTAHGRRIFVGGQFTLNELGELLITLEGFQYQVTESRWSGPALNSFETDHQKLENLKPFIFAVFMAQAGASVAEIRAKKADRVGYDPTSKNPFEEMFKQGKNSDQSQFYDEFFRAFFSQGYQGRASAGDKERYQKESRSQNLKWDPENQISIPLVYNAWLKKLGLIDERGNNKNYKINWAYYVLNVQADTPIADIKKQHRKLSMKFHSDRNKERSDAEEIQKSINEAWTIIEQNIF